jgi:hypothetical protein
VVLRHVRFTHPRGRLLVAPDGKLNIADLLPAASATPAAATPPSRPPAIGLARFLVEGGEFTFIDRSRSAPFETHFGPTSFVLRNFTTRPQRAGAYTFEAATEAGERFAWQGSLTFDPLGSAGRVAITDLSLPKYAAFHRDLHQLDLLSGRLGVELDYELDLTGAAPTARLRNGRVAVADLKLAARGTTAPLAAIPLVELTGIAADTAKQEASIATILIRGAELSATRRADGTIDWLALLQPATPSPITNHPAHSPASAPKPETQNPKPETFSAPWSATLGTFEIAGATLHLHDLTNPRPVDLVIDQLSFKLTGASTQLDKPVASPPASAGTAPAASPSTAPSPRSPSPPISSSMSPISRYARSIPTSRPSSTSSSPAAPPAPRGTSPSPSQPTAPPTSTGKATPASRASPPSTASSPSRSSASPTSRSPTSARPPDLSPSPSTRSP